MYFCDCNRNDNMVMFYCNDTRNDIGDNFSVIGTKVIMW